jgi:hypothetical protein
MEKYNIYCDETCHLEHDKEKVMVIGGIKCPKSRRKIIIDKIYNIKEEFNIPKMAEIKWNKISNCNLEYFKKLVDLFFDTQDLQFRAVVVDKTKLSHEQFGQTHNEFYYKMYYYCLIRLVDTQAENYIYMDKKDTKGTTKIRKLKEIISRKNHDFDQSKIARMQCVNSAELPILQLVDLLIGAVGYHNRQIVNPSEAKLELVRYIQSRTNYSLERSTYPSEQKFNLFFISLQGEAM